MGHIYNTSGICFNCGGPTDKPGSEYCVKCSVALYPEYRYEFNLEHPHKHRLDQNPFGAKPTSLVNK